jgi:predicted protein tyrosine phosphatase
MIRALFVCSQNKLRSPTAEQIFSKWPDVEADSAGLNHDAIVTLSPEQIEWADVVFVMDRSHRNRLQKKFKKFLNGKRVVCLNIPDEFEFMDPALVRLLEARVGVVLRSK